MRYALVAAATLVTVALFASSPSSAQSCVSDCGCPPGQICQPRDGGGRCAVGDCPEIYRPVCGMDGKTYGNACKASLQRIGVAHEGACSADGEACGGIAGALCPADQFCDHDPGQCDVADPSGTCTHVPENCLNNYDPVCGCDGETYGNDCWRKMARVPLAHSGECRDDPEQAQGCNCCHTTLVSSSGNLIWTGDPELDAVSRQGKGWYRLTWSTDVSADALFVQPVAPMDDFPRSLLGWPARIDETVVDVHTDVHFVEGNGTHRHREDLDVQFSFSRCPRPAEEEAAGE